jgi:two-component system response regulator WspF
MRIAIVNDMLMAVEALRRIVAADGKHQIAWIARDGAEAVNSCAADRPDLILMDLIMPVMDGVEATRQIMTRTPCGILIVTATVDGNRGKVFEALGAGALDAVNTPILGNMGRPTPESSALLYKIDLLGRLIQDPEPPNKLPLRAEGQLKSHMPPDTLVAIGASAGGPAAVAEVLKSLPANFGAAVILIQHVDSQFAAGLAEWLNQQSRLPVRLAVAGEVPPPGTVLVAGTDNHLVLSDERHVGYTESPRDHVYRPSVDVFYESVVRYWRGKVVGVLLTGMGRDGALGLKALRDAGHHTIAQDQATCAVYGMPKAAATLKAAVQILPLSAIASAIVQRCPEPAANTKTP